MSTLQALKFCFVCFLDFFLKVIHLKNLTRFLKKGNQHLYFENFFFFTASMVRNAKTKFNQGLVPRGHSVTARQR